MKWHSLHGTFRECTDPPYLLDGTGKEADGRLANLGLEQVRVQLTGRGGEAEILRRIGSTLGFPDTYKGGWDAFNDLLIDIVVDEKRAVAVHLLDADKLMRGYPRLFARLVWLLMNATEAVGKLGSGDSQLEFIFWGDWAATSAQAL